MFIELTDHLCCPADHAEQFLVLLPDRMDGRRVVSGDLGCPVCGRVVPIRDGVVDFDGAPASNGRTVLTAQAVAAFLGLSGPGGYLALVGGAASLADELSALLPGIHLALVNPPPESLDREWGSVIRAARLPLKTGSMRAVVVGPDAASDVHFRRDAVRVVLPGLRVVVEGGEPPEPGVEVLAQTEGCWVGVRQGSGVRDQGSRE